jgi:GNAT superfamily N-acetyltransferase/predicted nucleic acid-binding protein
MYVSKSKSENFEILSHFDSTFPFLEDVQKSADANRNALGFLPRSVFEEFSRRDNLYVFVKKLLNTSVYAGHLLFDRRFPRAQIVQMFVLEEHRNHGLATRLLDHLKVSLTQDGFTSIYARVAEDLIGTNIFWDKQHFYVQRVVKGGVTHNRQILVRFHELESPQLFPTSGIDAQNPLGLQISSSDVIPMFLLDLNVLFDLAPRRLRHDDALSLFQAERMNFCRLAISNEVREELRRTAYQGKTDPMEAYLNIFPSFPLSKGGDASVLLRELASFIFPKKANNQELKANELSDLHHVATVIQHDLAGLITNDNAILNAAPLITSKYEIEILSPAVFRLNSSNLPENTSFEASQKATLTLLDVSGKDESSIRALLAKLNLSGSKIISDWLPMQVGVAIRRAVWNESTLLGYLAWSARDTSGNTVARIAVDEADLQVGNAARILLVHLLEQLAEQGPRQIRLELASRQSVVRDLAIGFGFRGTPDQNCLIKLVLGRVLTKDTWSSCRKDLANKWALKLPEHMPIYRSADQHVQMLTPDGNQTHVKLDVLESLLYPALLCLQGRPAVITPVQKTFSEPLLGYSIQSSLLPSGSVSLFHERHYISNHRTLQLFRRGTLMFFYESTKQGGCGAIIALGRVREAYLRSAEALGESDFMQSVLSAASLGRIGKSKMKTVTVFDNIFHLPRRVPLKTLKLIGCGRPNDLITTRSVTDDQLQKILDEAFSDG